MITRECARFSFRVFPSLECPRICSYTRISCSLSDSLSSLSQDRQSRKTQPEGQTSDAAKKSFASPAFAKTRHYLGYSSKRLMNFSPSPLLSSEPMSSCQSLSHSLSPSIRLCRPLGEEGGKNGKKQQAKSARREFSARVYILQVSRRNGDGGAHQNIITEESR